MTELERLRAEIDQIDRELVALFLARQEVARGVGEYKQSVGLPVLDAGREAVVLEGKRALAPDEATGREVVALFETLMGLSRARQTDIVHGQNRLEVQSLPADAHIIFQGEAGAYTEQAAVNFFGESAHLTPTPHWRDVFDALAQGRAQFGVLPIENSTTGGISQVYDLLAQRSANIVGEVIVPVRHCLMGLPGADIGQLEEVFSHPQGFYQCGEYLRDKPFACTEMGNTALAAQYVAKLGNGAKAAIGSPRAAQVYGLEILAEDINDAQQNQTRFLVVQPRASRGIVPHADKVSVLFTLPHRSGTLYEVMRIFAAHKLNLLKLESRPLGERPWEYLFFVDFAGNLEEPPTRAALTELKAAALSLEVLGNYRGVAQ